MTLRSRLFIIFSFLLVGCVNKDYVGFDPNLEWSIRGKISVSAAEFTGVYNFAGFHKSEANEIVVSSSFGIELFRITFLFNGVSVEDSLVESFLGQSKVPDNTLQRNLNFIWRWLPHWVAGRDKRGQPLQMVSEEDGWSIELSKFNGIRPRVIILNKRDIRVKIKISDFENLI